MAYMNVINGHSAAGTSYLQATGNFPQDYLPPSGGAQLERGIMSIIRITMYNVYNI